MIKHEPHFDTEKIIEHYTKKDGVPITYVCTSALGHEAQAMDIFYRETPHPEFGNRYFGLYRNAMSGDIMITNADRIEQAEFELVEDDDGNLQYSAHRHDYKRFENGNMIDGGRAYIKSSMCEVKHYVVRNGEMVEKKDAEISDENLDLSDIPEKDEQFFMRAKKTRLVRKRKTK